MKKLIIALLMIPLLASCIKQEPAPQIQSLEILTDNKLSLELVGEDYTSFVELFTQREPISAKEHTFSTFYTFTYEDELYRFYPYSEEIYFNCLTNSSTSVIDNSETVAQWLELIPLTIIDEEYDPDILTPFEYPEPLQLVDFQQADVSNGMSWGHTSSSEYQSIYIDNMFYLDIYNNQVIITDCNTNRSFVVNEIENPKYLAFRSDCGGFIDFAVLTQQNELYLASGFGYSYSDGVTTVDYDISLSKVITDEVITEISVYDDTNLFTTCGSAVYYAQTEDGALRVVRRDYEKTPTGYKAKDLILGKTREETHPYKRYLEAGNRDNLFVNQDNLNMVYVFEDNTLHLGYATYEEDEKWSNEPISNEQGKPLYAKEAFYEYQLENKYLPNSAELIGLWIVSTDNQLYYLPIKNEELDLNKSIKLTPKYPTKLKDIELEENNEQNYYYHSLQLTFTDNSTLALEGTYSKIPQW